MSNRSTVLLAPGSQMPAAQRRQLADMLRKTPGITLHDPTTSAEVESLRPAPGVRLVVVAPRHLLLPTLNALPRAGRDLDVALVEPTGTTADIEAGVRRATAGVGAAHALPCLRLESTQLRRPHRALAVRAGRAAGVGRAVQEASTRSSTVGRLVSGLRGVARELAPAGDQATSTVVSLWLDAADVAEVDAVEVLPGHSMVGARVVSMPTRRSPAGLLSAVTAASPRQFTEVRLVATGYVLCDGLAVQTGPGDDWRITLDEPLQVLFA